MPYFGVDDGFAFHRKTLKAGNAAVGLWTRAGAWCNQQLTDGFVPEEMVGVLGTKAQAGRLVKAGLWTTVDGGYQFHEWAEEGRNFTRSEVLAKREKERERKAKQRATIPSEPQVNGSRPSGTDTGHDADTQRDSDPPIPIPSQEEKKKTSSSSPRKRGTRIPDDFAVTSDMVAWARDRVPRVDGAFETEKFVNYWQSKPGKDGVKLDWVATWRNWMLTAAERTPARASPNGVHPTDQNVALLMGTSLRALPGGQS